MPCWTLRCARVKNPDPGGHGSGGCLYARRTVDTDPPELGSKEVNAFLTHLAVELHVSASTQNQALAAFLFLYRELLERDLDLEV